jgi:hypothetical protein
MTTLSSEIFGWLSLALAIFGYIPYVLSIRAGETKPHCFSWFIWGVLTAIAYAAQTESGAGPGSWATGLTVLVCLLVTALSAVYGEKRITRSDWLTFLAALTAIPIWYATSNPFYAILLVTLIDALGFWPTFRKSWHKPFEEHPLTYTLSAIKFLLSLLAISNFTWTTALYPASLVLMNSAFVIMVLVRRYKIDNTAL